MQLECAIETKPQGLRPVLVLFMWFLSISFFTSVIVTCYVILVLSLTNTMFIGNLNSNNFKERTQ